jgi:MFS family permease
MNEQKPGEAYGHQFATNIPRYFVYAALYGFGFGPILAVWVIFLQQKHGFSLPLVTLTDVAFWLTMALCEVPTGVVADKFGRKTSLALGAGLLGIGTLAWAVASTVPLIIATYTVLGVGLTFLSGRKMRSCMNHLSWRIEPANIPVSLGVSAQ